MASKSHEKQLRVQGPRSSLGCQTCKSRHVKCDMQKPHCQRCIKANRSCNYTNGSSSQRARHFIVYSVPVSPRATPDLDDSSRRALHQYRTHTAAAIAYPFSSELWSSIAIQVCEKYDFVMSAVVALSGMYELYFQPPNVQSPRQAEVIRHYNKAIRGVVALGQDGKSIDAILVTCIVFSAIESLRGSWTRALRHALSGMQIIKERRRIGASEADIPHKVLDEAFLALQIQVMEFGGREDSRVYTPTANGEPYVPDKFTGIDEALHHLNVLYNECSYLLDRIKLNDQDEEDLPDAYDPVFPSLLQQISFITTRLGRFGVALEELRARTEANPTSQESQAILVLKMYYAGFQYAMDKLTGGTSDYTTVMEYAEAFFKCQDQNSGATNRTYSMSVGVMPILFMLATQDDVDLRERSFDILRMHWRREGPWDSQVAVKLAQKVIDTKQELSKLHGGNCTVSIAYMNFEDDNTCRFTYFVNFTEPDTEAEAFPVLPRDTSATHVNVVEINEGADP